MNDDSYWIHKISIDFPEYRENISGLSNKNYYYKLLINNRKVKIYDLITIQGYYKSFYLTEINFNITYYLYDTIYYLYKHIIKEIYSKVLILLVDNNNKLLAIGLINASIDYKLTLHIENLATINKIFIFKLSISEWNLLSPDNGLDLVMERVLNIYLYPLNFI